MNKQTLQCVIEKINDKCLWYAQCELNITDEDYENDNEVVYEVGDLQSRYFQEDFTEFLLESENSDEIISLIDDSEIAERLDDCGWEHNANEEA